MEFDRLENNIIDVIKEQQAKLGYRKEIIRLYYPLSSLNHLLGSNLSENEMLDAMKQFSEYTSDSLGCVRAAVDRERFCLEIPEGGSEYVHANTSENEFIVQLVDIISKHGCTIDDITTLFKSHSQKVVVKQSNDDDFDYVIFFEDDGDKYIYCFKDEGCHMTYHRFLPEDFEELF